MQSQTRRIKEAQHGYRPAPGARHRVLEVLGMEGAVLHELDYEDLALTRTAMRMVRQAAVEVLGRFGSVEPTGIPLARALALFLDHVFWDEKTGGLILCADFPDQSYCLPLPRDLWGLRNRQDRVQ